MKFKTVQISSDVHKNVRKIASADEKKIGQVVDELLRPLAKKLAERRALKDAAEATK